MLDEFDKEEVIIVVKNDSKKNELGVIIPTLQKKIVQGVVTRGNFKTTTTSGEVSYIKGLKLHLETSTPLQKGMQVEVRGSTYTTLNNSYMYRSHSYVEVISNE